MKIIIAIDDTDNLESRGTGFRARELGLLLAKAGLVDLISVTRHQLLFDRRIPYTSHNSSASLLCELKSSLQDVIAFSKEYLIKEAADGSDAGLCIAIYEKVNQEIINWGHKAKIEILTKEKAHELAIRNEIYLEGFTGEKIGVIGSLAAVGLRKEGSDGRLLWMKNMRETTGIFKISDYKALIGLENISDKDGIFVSENENILVTEWCRPIHKNNEITLIVEKEQNSSEYEWKCASKEYIKSISQ
ncbi:MAG: ABC transporter substrate-binding protein [Bacteroidia bacterium]|nr:ABC transporter substrate-binding protein [Bacteroidia bacterium]